MDNQNQRTTPTPTTPETPEVPKSQATQTGQTTFTNQTHIPSAIQFSPQFNDHTSFTPHEAPQNATDFQKTADHNNLKIRYEHARFQAFALPILGVIITAYIMISTKGKIPPFQNPILPLIILITLFAIATIAAIIRTLVLGHYYHVPPEQTDVSVAAYYKFRRKANIIGSFVATALFLAAAVFCFIFFVLVYKEDGLTDIGLFTTFICLLFACGTLINGILCIKRRWR